ncbi:RNA-directed DNA polymerase from mobile element jockey [Paramuricea clavata]|uniref:RNA-directed DNA polymerase from mobile element jockey n=1 Tax=Paramuricea clavata TaxID=317549 RepID=A0A6S7HFS8_PARCT|nr:RNA-directed DNA polymerase from mobile element jockey [Paramuricea clavata]
MASEDWTTVYSALDVDEKVSAYNSIIIKMLDEFLPEKTIRVHHSDKPWITGNIKMQIKARQKAFSRGDQPRYKQLCEKVANLIAKAKATYYRSKASEFRTSNQSKWYNCIHSLVNAENTTHTQFPHGPENLDLSDLAEKLQKAFTKPWSDRYTNVAFEIPEVNHPHKNNKPPLPSIGQVKAVLKHLNPRKATGIDKVPAWMLKQYHKDLAPVVYDIVCCSISQCCYPSLYKHALISPVPKVQPPRDINNDFRQISVLPHLAKILEKIQLQLNIEDLKIKNNQHAFTQHRSTVSALISTTQTWFNATDCSKTGKMGVHAAFIDFRKAFDLVDHNILLNKLAAMNINKPFWLWIKSFLSGRVQQVNLNGTLSSIATCPAGVPQGSVISPILFNTYIDDLEDALPEQLKVSTNKYADDCTQHQIVSVDSNSNLQQSINEVNNWAVLNKMAINAKKTKDMWISFTDAIPEPPRLRIGNELIERVNAFKLLGVSFQNNLKWNAHVEEITRKANKRLYHLRECRKSQLPPEVGIITYQSKIRPILEYASPVWAGLPNYLRDEIERVQSRSLRILGLEKDYLPPLNERREEATSREVDRFMNDPHHPCRSVLPKLINNQYNLRNIDRNRNISFFSGTERHKHSFSVSFLNYLTTICNIKTYPQHIYFLKQVIDVGEFKNYKIFMSTIFKLLGSNSTIDEEVNRIVDLEREFEDVKETFDPRDVKNLKKNIKFMTLDELNKFTSGKFNWTVYFEEILNGTKISIPSNLKLMILLPNNIKKIVDWIKAKPKSLLANEIIWNVIRGLISNLPVAFRAAQDKYTQRYTPRWRICNLLTDNYFTFATTLLYVNKHLPEDARKTAAEMFTEIKGQFIDGLKEQTWMDPGTRAQARLKLQKMTDVIGFPSFIKDPATLNAVYGHVQVDQYHLFQNTLNIFREIFWKKLTRLGRRATDSTRSSFSYLQINAFYNPQSNGMTILAGILQPPFYKGDRLKALNYGSLGMVVGHEITHGFDKLGKYIGWIGKYQI